MDEYNQQLTIRDATSMFRRQLNKNERPYTATIIKLNNALVDEWEKKILNRISSNGTVLAGRVYQSWQLFTEGKAVQKIKNMLDNNLFNRPTEGVLEWWKNLFETSSIEVLHSYGSATIAFGWTIIQNELRLRSAEEKWEKIFSKSDDPYDWEELRFKHQDLINGRIYPFWNEEILKEIQEKISTILHVQAEPIN